MRANANCKQLQKTLMNVDKDLFVFLLFRKSIWRTRSSSSFAWSVRMLYVNFFFMRHTAAAPLARYYQHLQHDFQCRLNSLISRDSQTICWDALTVVDTRIDIRISIEFGQECDRRTVETETHRVTHSPCCDIRWAEMTSGMWRHSACDVTKPCDQCPESPWESSIVYLSDIWQALSTRLKCYETIDDATEMMKKPTVDIVIKYSFVRNKTEFFVIWYVKKNKYNKKQFIWITAERLMTDATNLFQIVVQWLTCNWDIILRFSEPNASR